MELCEIIVSNGESVNMFRKIGEEKAFDAILNQIIDNIQDGNIKGGDALPAERTMAESM